MTSAAAARGLTSLTELQPEIVKLDMSLVRDVHMSTRNNAERFV